MPGPPAVITTNAEQQFNHNYINRGKGNIQQQRNSITLLLKIVLRFHHGGEKRCLNRIPGIINYQKPVDENIFKKRRQPPPGRISV